MNVQFRSRHTISALLLGAILTVGVLPAAAQTGTATPVPFGQGANPAMLLPTVEAPGLMTPTPASFLGLEGSATPLPATMVAPGIPAVSPDGSRIRSGAAGLEVAGTVQAATLSLIIVNNMVIDISSAAMNAQPGVGALVLAEGALNDSGVMVASLITTLGTAPTSATPSGIDLTGTLLEIGEGFIILSSRIEIDASRLSADLRPGGAVIVTLNPANGGWVASWARPAAQ